MPCTKDTARCRQLRGNDGRVLDLNACCLSHIQEVLFYATDLLVRNNIRHWIDYGTLLGAVRTGRLIPWDGDADMGFLAEDREEILALKQTIEEDGYWLDTKEFAPVWDHTAYSHNIIRIRYSYFNSLHVDLFPWWEENGKMHKIWFGSRGGHKAMGREFDRRFINNLDRISLCGKDFPCPSPPEDFIRFRFGDNYKTERRG